MNKFHLYLAEFSEGIVKVGASRNVDLRATQIENYAGRQFGADMRNFCVVRPLEEDTWRMEEMAVMSLIKAEAEPLPQHQEWFRGIAFGRAYELCLQVSSAEVAPSRFVYNRNAKSMHEGLTPRQAEVLAYIRSVYESTGRSPTMKEIAGHFGCLPNASQCVVDVVIRKGYLSKLRGARGLIPTGKTIVMKEFA